MNTLKCFLVRLVVLLGLFGAMPVWANVDLVISQLSTATTSVPVGGSFTVSNTEKNQGAASTTIGHYVDLYLSTDSTITTADYRIGSRWVSNYIAAGADSADNTTVTISNSVPPGSYYLGAIADSSNNQVETIETNNTLATATKITVVRDVDLVVSALSTTATSVPVGGSFTISNTEKNQGTTSSTIGHYVEFYLSTDNTITTSDYLVSSRWISSDMAAGTTNSDNTVSTISNNIPPGTYYLGAIADASNNQVENNETNNTLLATGTITIVRSVDLTVSALSTTTTSLAPGSSLSIAHTEKNQGSTPSTYSHYVEFYLSSDNTITTADTYIGGRWISSDIAAGVSNSYTDTATVPASTPPGSYFLGAIADPSNNQPETNESNNTFVATNKVTLTSTSTIDLTMTALSASLTSVAPGGTLTINNTERNQGTTAANTAHTVKLYLSADSVWQSSDTLLTTRTITSLAAATDSAAATSVTIPSTTTAGSYYLIAIADADGAVAESSETNNTMVSSTTISIGNTQIDLLMTLMTPSSTNITAGVATNVSLNNTVKNQGTGNATSFTVGYYLSSDATWQSSDTLLASRSVSSLATNASNNASTTVTIPATTPAGFYYLIAYADSGNTQSESTETNNTLASSKISVSTADLKLNSVSFTPASITAGSALAVTDIVANAGSTATTAAVTIRYYLSADAVYQTTDIALGARTVASGMAANTTAAAVSTSLTVPATVAAGSYYVIGIVDADNVQPESNEANNTTVSTTSVVVLVNGIDLTLTAVPPAANGVAPGGTLTVSSTERNQGNTAATAHEVKFYLSTDAVYQTSDTYLGTRAIAGLASNTNDTANAALVIPSTTAAGYYYIIAVADGGSTQTEANETNNTLASSKISVSTADLKLNSVSFTPASITAGSALAVTDIVANAGSSATTAAVTIRYYLSADAAYQTTDIALGARTVASGMAANTTAAAVSTSLTVPATVAAGSYYIIGIVDADNVQPESNEANNTTVSTTSVVVLVNGIDLALTAVTPAANGVAPGGTLTVSSTERNQGNTAATAHEVKFYLSTDAVYQTTDTYLGTRAIAGLASNTNDTGNAALVIPSTTAAGYYYIIAVADGGSTQTEVNETNNTRASSKISVSTADLKLNSVSFTPASITAGSALAVTDIVANAGSSATTAAVTIRYYLSADAAYQSTDIALGARTVASGMAANTTAAAVSTSLTVPATVAAGSYYVIGIVDADNVQPESNEANNLTASTTNLVVLTNGIDLIMTVVIPAGGTIAPGGTLTVSSTERNQGNTAATAHEVKFYLSTDAVYQTTDTYLGTRAIAGLAGNANDTATAALPIPATTTVGYYYIIAVADGGNTQAEASETNNTRASAIGVGTKDLVISALSSSATSVTIGGNLVISNTETNNGTLNIATAHDVKLYLSADATLQSTDYLLVSRSISNLNAATSNAANTSVTIPSTVPAGTYYIIAQADANSNVLESNEANNTKVTSTTIAVTSTTSQPKIYYIDPDHLGTPRVITDTAGNKVWERQNTEPFGDNTPVVETITFNLGYPGQYYDKETGLYYNWNRTYDPRLGRYTQSDPIGLAGGLNTFLYVGGSPLTRIDPDGRMFFGIPLYMWAVGGVGVGGAAWWGLNNPWALGNREHNGGPMEMPEPVDMAKGGQQQDVEKRTVPMPTRPKCGCTCTCRADANQNDPNNTPAFAFGTATAHNCAEASKEAKRNATRALGQQPKHVGCRCAGS